MILLEPIDSSFSLLSHAYELKMRNIRFDQQLSNSECFSDIKYDRRLKMPNLSI